MMRCFKNITLALLAVLVTIPVLRAEDHKLLDKFSSRLDSIERRFWRIAPLQEDHRERPGFNSAINELEVIARELRHSCTKYEKGPIPELRGDVSMLNRVLFQFKINSRTQNRRIYNINATGPKAYTSRHHRLMRELAKEKGEKYKSSTKLPPKLSEINIEDYSEFLDDINDKNSRRFSNWAGSLDSRSRIQNAEQIFAVYQKAICDMRMKLVKMAKYATFKEEKKK